MKVNNKIQAFTLSELVVVLILTVIVVGLAFSVLSLVQKQMTTIQKNYITKLELNKLETSLWLDFNRYSKITYDEIENELKFSNELDSVIYQFSENRIVKDMDTFPIQIQNMQLFFDGELSKSSVLDAIKLETTNAHQSQKLFVFKINDASIYINNEWDSN